VLPITSSERNIAVVVPDNVVIATQIQVVFHRVDHLAERVAAISKHLCCVVRVVRAGRQLFSLTADRVRCVLERLRITERGDGRAIEPSGNTSPAFVAQIAGPSSLKSRGSVGRAKESAPALISAMRPNNCDGVTVIWRGLTGCSILLARPPVARGFGATAITLPRSTAC
jgi:hypothetical protein